MNDIVNKVLDSGLIQKVEQVGDLLLLSFAFEANDRGVVYFYNYYSNKIFSDNLYHEIIYFGSLLVDYDGNVIKGILDSVIFENYDKCESDKKMAYNKTQMISKLDKINLSKMFSIKQGFILPYCSTNATVVWKDCIKRKYRKTIYGYYTNDPYSFSNVWRYIGRNEFISYDLLERKCKLENFMAESNNKVRCARIIGKSIVSASQNISESVKGLGNSVIEANNDLSRTIGCKDMNFISAKNHIV